MTTASHRITTSSHPPLVTGLFSHLRRDEEGCTTRVRPRQWSRPVVAGLGGSRVGARGPWGSPPRFMDGVPSWAATCLYGGDVQGRMGRARRCGRLGIRGGRCDRSRPCAPCRTCPRSRTYPRMGTPWFWAGAPCRTRAMGARHHGYARHGHVGRREPALTAFVSCRPSFTASRRPQVAGHGPATPRPGVSLPCARTGPSGPPRGDRRSLAALPGRVRLRGARPPGPLELRGATP